MALLCTACLAPIAPASINIERMVAKCDACGEVFRFEALLGAPARARASVPRPKSITVAGDVASVPGEVGYRENASAFSRSAVTLTRRWFTPAAIFLLFFAIVWDGFLFFWYAMALADPNRPIVALLFPLAHVAIGVFIGYTALTGLFNRTAITLGAGSLSVRHGPLPWPGNVTLPTATLRQLFVRRRITRGKNGSTTTYALCADVDGTARDLVRTLRTEDEARYLEQTIESHLAIVDDPTAGDV